MSKFIILNNRLTSICIQLELINFTIIFYVTFYHYYSIIITVTVCTDSEYSYEYCNAFILKEIYIGIAFIIP
jgi:hypothetical protein